MREGKRWEIDPHRLEMPSVPAITVIPFHPRWSHPPPFTYSLVGMTGWEIEWSETRNWPVRKSFLRLHPSCWLLRREWIRRWRKMTREGRGRELLRDDPCGGWGGDGDWRDRSGPHRRESDEPWWSRLPESNRLTSFFIQSSKWFHFISFIHWFHSIHIAEWIHLISFIHWFHFILFIEWEMRNQFVFTSLVRVGKWAEPITVIYFYSSSDLSVWRVRLPSVCSLQFPEVSVLSVGFCWHHSIRWDALPCTPVSVPCAPSDWPSREEYHCKHNLTRFTYFLLHFLTVRMSVCRVLWAS